MEAKIIFKDYGNGKERFILVNKSDGNRAFASFGKKDIQIYEYLEIQFKKQEDESKSNQRPT